MKHHTPPATPSTTSTITTATTAGECGNCGTQTHGFLFHVRLRCVQRRLCTPCVLRLHPSLFCPVCFSFYDSNPPHPSKRISCSKCASLTHSHCATSISSISVSQPYLCPPCSDPTKSFAAFSNSISKTPVHASSKTKRLDRIDGKSAAVLLCAAKIAAASMGKAVLLARMEAEKKSKEAALSRKKAREALEHVAFLISKNKESSVQLSGSASFFNNNQKRTISQELINSIQTDKV